MKRGYVYTLLIVLGLCAASFLVGNWVNAYTFNETNATTLSMDWASGPINLPDNGIIFSPGEDTDQWWIAFKIFGFNDTYSQYRDAWCVLWATLRDRNNTTVYATSSSFYFCDQIDLLSSAEYTAHHNVESIFGFNFDYSITAGTDYLVVPYIISSFGVAEIDTRFLQFGTTTPDTSPFTNIEWNVTNGEYPEYRLWVMYNVGSYSEIGEGDITFSFPTEGLEVHAGEWSDWWINYDMGVDDLNDVWLLKVDYQDTEGEIYNDADFNVTTTTELTLWNIPREHNLPDGAVTATAQMWGSDDCVDPEATDGVGCNWRLLGYDTISFSISSSSGYEYWDTGQSHSFTPATTTIEGQDTANIFTDLWNGVVNIFPLGIALQILDLFNSMAEDPNITPVSIELSDILPVEASSVVGSSTLLSANLLETGMGTTWTTYFYPGIQTIIWIGTLILLTAIIFPRSSTNKKG